jgi:exonuclease III
LGQEKKVKELILREKVDVLAIQESKLALVDKNLCARLWGGEGVGWRSAPAIGRSGGIITLWDATKGHLVESFQGQGYVGVVLLWGASKIKCVIINVYAPCLIHAKKSLWVDLLVALKVYGTNHICLLGDFNSVRSGEERNGMRVGGGWSEDSRLFNVLVENSGLVDLPLLGRKFTWIQPNGNCMSRLDRILVSDGWLAEWGSVTLWGLKRDVSDHCPIILKYDG